MRILVFFLLLVQVAFSQSKKFQRKIDAILKNTVTTVKVDQVELNDSTLYLDARELKEYKVSHLKNSVHIGFDKFDLTQFTNRFPDKNKPIVIYCSIGARSEIIGEKLIDSGYQNVYNLYGGIFEWKNQNNAVYDSLNYETNKVHTYSKEWSKWLKNGEKIYEE